MAGVPAGFLALDHPDRVRRARRIRAEHGVKIHN
jgi:hypothetical protein